MSSRKYASARVYVGSRRRIVTARQWRKLRAYREVTVAYNVPSTAKATLRAQVAA